MQQPHVPRTPHPRFEGLSELGPRGDAIVEADWCLGELKKTLEEEGILENTLIIFSSDNGPVLNDGYYDDSDVKMEVILPGVLIEEENIVFLKQVHVFHFSLIGKERLNLEFLILWLAN